MNWNNPVALLDVFTASGFPRDSHRITERASSTRSVGKYCDTRGRHRSTASPGGRVVVGGGAVVVVGGGATVVVTGGAVVVVDGG